MRETESVERESVLLYKNSKVKKMRCMNRLVSILGMKSLIDNVEGENSPITNSIM